MGSRWIRLLYLLLLLFASRHHEKSIEGSKQRVEMGVVVSRIFTSLLSVASYYFSIAGSNKYLNKMSSLYLCRDCSGAFHSMDELQRHEREEHDMEEEQGETTMTMDEQEKMNVDDEITMIQIKIEDTDSLSDTDSSHVSMNPTTPSVQSASGERGRYECEECHEMFLVKRELATHMRIHSGEKPHSCTQCGKEFGTRQLLKKHWMWHTGERSHVCPHCNKAFFQKGHLTQHLMIHSGGRPHECPQCHKTFIFKFDLNRHMKIHQERGFSCQQCGRSFLKQAMLDEHHLKCKGKPSSPIRSLLTPTMKAGLESFSVKQEPIVLSPETIAKMAQKLLIQQQENQRSALNNLLVKQQQENILNNNNNNETNILNNKDLAFETPVPALPLNLTCMLCKSQFNNQSSFTLHMYMYHFANQNTNLSLDSTLLSFPQHHHPVLQTATTIDPVTLGSDSDPATDTSCASSPQKTSPLQLLESTCLDQSSVSPMSSSGASPQPTASESSTTSSSCKDCSNSWQRIQDLEQQVLKKDEEFEAYKKMTKQLITNVSSYLTSTQTPENMFMMNAANVFTQIKNSL
ncbi:hypothetical protein L3Y34_003790 [Caenorhabditis briggsae]|uniref:C2H2-type domain-containing protein n=1 Tax=Caenorhabditis briggsae TaxID=6238 RepID=A0AAE9D5I3_CAEBR|nr:hypothetical protein L3Y34_003790 [Caenorhabditis briggsae]